MDPMPMDLHASPDLYLHSFQGNEALLVPMDRAAYHRSIFLDRRISPAADRPVRTVTRLLSASLPPRLQTNWIFHVAHCGSTLLARALDQLQTNLVLREPLALRQLALDFDAERLSIAAALLSRRYERRLPTIVKANVPVNFLLPKLIELDPQARAIFLFLDLNDYLFAILRSEGNRGWLRNVTAQLGPHLGDLGSLSDGERAAALWQAQIEAFAAAVSRMPFARALNGESFFAAPAHFVRLAADHLDVPMDDGAIAKVVAGPLFATYSKNPELAFDNERRISGRAELARLLAPEIEKAEQWVAESGSAEKAMAVIAAVHLGREDPVTTAKGMNVSERSD
jgi:hypothetical protein